MTMAVFTSPLTFPNIHVQSTQLQHVYTAPESEENSVEDSKIRQHSELKLVSSQDGYVQSVAFRLRLQF